MKEDFFKSKEVKKLRKIAGGDTYTIIYQKMIILSLRNEGRLFYDGVEDSFAEEIALEIDEDIDNVKATLVFLTKFGLVDQMGDSELVVNEAVKNIGTESESAERVRLHRERKNNLALQCNDYVTKCNTEIDKDLELEKEKDIYIEQNDKIDPLDSRDNFIKEYALIFQEITGIKHRRISESFDFNDATRETEYEVIYGHISKYFQEGKIDMCYMEYFNTVVDRYR